MDTKQLKQLVQEHIVDPLPSDVRGLVVAGLLAYLVQAAGPIVVASEFFYYGAWIVGGVLVTRLFRPPMVVRTRGTIESTGIFVRMDGTCQVFVAAILRNLSAPSCFTDWKLFVRLKDGTEWHQLQMQYIDRPFTAGTQDGRAYAFYPETLLHNRGLNAVPQGGALTGMVLAESKNHTADALKEGMFRLTCVDVAGREHVIDQAQSMVHSSDAYPPVPLAVRMPVPVAATSNPTEPQPS